MFYYLDCINKCISMFNKGFLNDYLPELLKAVKKKILSSSEPIIKSVRRDRIEGII